MRLLFALLFAAFAVAACGGQNQTPVVSPSEIPLPPASGTPIGYLIDSAPQLKLTDDQLAQLKDLDADLAAKDADVDVQLRQIEKPEEEESQSPQEQKAHVKPHRYNNAPGASVKTNDDAQKLHRIRDANDKAALVKAWAVLDTDQRVGAKKIFEDRGVEVPGEQKAEPKPDEAGTPMPGMEP